MLFELGEEQQQLKKNARDFLEKEIIPIASERDKKGPFSKEEIKEYILMLKPLGYVVGPIPKEWGGGGLSFTSQMVLAEELARVWISLLSVVEQHAGIAGLIAHIGTEEQKKKFIPPALAGDSLLCEMMSEPDSGSDTRAIKTTAILDGDAYVVNGVKRWSSNGALGDVAILSALSDPELFVKSGYGEGLIRLIVEKKVSPWKARNLPLIGARAANIGEIVFENCRVPKENLLPVKGYSSQLRTRGAARVMTAIVCTGIMQAAVDDSIKYAKQRVQFGKPIGGFQLVQEMIADMVTDLEVSRLLNYRACELIDNHIRCDLEQNMAKVYATEAVKRVTDKAIQVHGALGLTTDEGYSVERYFRDARPMSIGEGTTQIAKLVMGRRLLGIQAFV
jgi:alkylation response protein AidB-like acyl-CoA dehydrogenase